MKANILFILNLQCLTHQQIAHVRLMETKNKKKKKTEKVKESRTQIEQQVRGECIQFGIIKISEI